MIENDFRFSDRVKEVNARVQLRHNVFSIVCPIKRYDIDKGQFACSPSLYKCMENDYRGR